MVGPGYTQPKRFKATYPADKAVWIMQDLKHLSFDPKP